MPHTYPLRPRLSAAVLAVVLAATLCACSGPTATPAAATPPAAATDTAGLTGEGGTLEVGTAETARPAGWSAASHGSEAEPDYAVVFPQDRVNEITITIAPDDGAAMQANMTELFGEPGQEGGFGGPGGRRGGDLTPENPMWVPATVEFNGQIWTNVGVRYKGNSSLTSGWRSGSLKLPLKLDFDEFENEHPEVENQRFYGFKQLSLANGFGDASFLREAITYDLLEAAGLVAAETAYYQVTLDYGEGPQNLGLYIAVEVIDDTVIERVFGGDSGNIYEGDGPAASLAAGTQDQIEASFQKENNAAEADWSDLEALYAVLHSELRTSDPTAWRAELETVFDTDTFLKWLALSAAIEHWDSYGAMPHNYYLYHDPETGQLTWISWDHNLVLGAGFGPRGGPGGGPDDAPPGGAPPAGGFVPGRGGPVGGSTALDKSDVGADWPLIRYLLDDPVYYAAYLQHLETASGLLDSQALAAGIDHRAALIAPYVARESSEQSFTAAVQALKTRLAERADVVAEFLSSSAQ